MGSMILPGWPWETQAGAQREREVGQEWAAELPEEEEREREGGILRVGMWPCRAWRDPGRGQRGPLALCGFAERGVLGGAGLEALPAWAPEQGAASFSTGQALPESPSCPWPRSHLP